MHILKELFKKKENNKYEYNSETENYLRQFENLVSEASYIIESDINFFEDEGHPIFIFIKQITDYITVQASLNSYNNDQVDMTRLLGILFFNDNSDYIHKIAITETHSNDYKLYKKSNTKTYPKVISFDYSNCPIIINPWRMRRTSDAIIKIATKDNKFDSLKYKSNITNEYMYPLGIVVCFNGNHSQYSAKLKNSGKTHIELFYNISNLYDYITFNGEKFMYNFPDRKFEIVTSNDQEFYLGVLFEIGRLLLNKKNLFPKSIQNLLVHS